MFSFRLPMLFCLFVLTSAFATAAEWRTTDTENSTISFIASYDGIPFTGTFSNFQSTIHIGEDLENSFIYAQVDMTSFDTRSRDRDEALVESDWFDTTQFAQAYFRSTVIRKEGGSFYADGIINIKDIEQTISFPFEWNASDTIAKFKAAFPLDRRTFRIGDGVWIEDETIGFEVEVQVDLQLERVVEN